MKNLPFVKYSGEIQPLLIFQSLRVSTNQDIPMIVSVYENQFLIFKNISETTPTYQIQLSLNLRIEWQFSITNNRETLAAFGFNHKNRMRWFYSQESDLRKFQLCLGNKIINSNINNFYSVGNLIAAGSTAKICIIVEKSTQKVQASKCISKQQNLVSITVQQAVLQEVQSMQCLSHPNIIQLDSTYEGSSYYYILTEYLEGPHLGEYMMANAKTITLHQIQIITKQILMGLNHMHTRGIMHRDIKPENIVFKSKNSIQNLKIIDFGLATRWNLQSYFQTRCGTPGYMAPEIMNSTSNQLFYDSKCDIFSLGVLLYKMITFKNLFTGSSVEEIYMKNISAIMDLEPLKDPEIPLRVKDLILKMIEIDPKRRISAAEALTHEFFCDLNSDSINTQDQNEMTTLDNFSFSPHNAVKVTKSEQMENEDQPFNNLSQSYNQIK